jgi:hypothetical protein
MASANIEFCTKCDWSVPETSYRRLIKIRHEANRLATAEDKRVINHTVAFHTDHIAVQNTKGVY